MKVYQLDSGQGGIDRLKKQLAHDLLETQPIHRGEWQANQVSDVLINTHELANVTIEYDPSPLKEKEQELLKPDLPWAEVHFRERVSGEPLNPPPSFKIWPYHKGHEEEHINQGEFSHSYPERYWPAEAKNADQSRNFGIRYAYGDLEDVLNMLKLRPFSRQAYLPVWFPEDTGAREHQRVPCSLGYHFIRNGHQLDCNYFLRSCDITRHMVNDIYLTVRLMQWITKRVHAQTEGINYPLMGKLTVFISNLHLFVGDRWRFQ